MKEFIVRLFSLLAIVGVLFGYNEVLDVRVRFPVLCAVR